jgi:ketosteroid isomerase-like protein
MQKRNLYAGLANNMFVAMNTRDFEPLKPRLSDNVVFHFPGSKPLEGPRRLILFLNALTRKYKDLTFRITDVLIDEYEHKACVVWTNSGKHPDGSDYQNSGLTLLKFESDKICFLSDYFKDTSFTQSI